MSTFSFCDIVEQRSDNMRKNRIYTAEFKIEVVRKIIDEHIGIKAMSKKHGITSSLTETK